VDHGPDHQILLFDILKEYFFESVHRYEFVIGSRQRSAKKKKKKTSHIYPQIFIQTERIMALR